MVNDKFSLKTELIVTGKTFYQKVHPKVNLIFKTKGTLLLNQTEHVRWYVPLCLRRSYSHHSSSLCIIIILQRTKTSSQRSLFKYKLSVWSQVLNRYLSFSQFTMDFFSYSSENLVWDKHDLIYLMIFFILITCLLNRVLILWGKVRCWSLTMFFWLAGYCCYSRCFSSPRKWPNYHINQQLQRWRNAWFNWGRIKHGL